MAVMEAQARWLRWLSGLLAGTAVVAIILILSGMFDPQPVGTLQWERPLTRQIIPTHTRRIVWLDETTPDEAYSLRLQAAYQSGETDIVYGLALGSDDDYLAVIASPLGYTGIAEVHPSFIIHRLPFRPWPHVRPDANEIWLDVIDGRVTARINREWLWEGEIADISGQIGLVVESFGETAVIDFQTIQLLSSRQ